MAIYAIRHTTVNIPADICYGQADVPLSESFERELRSVLQKLTGKNYDKVFSSPATRCRKLAERISTHYTVDDRLQELNFGNWEMKKWGDISDPYLFEWMENYVTFPCPNGESLQDMIRRVEGFYEAHLKDDLDCIIVTHAGVIRCLHHIIKDIALKELFNLEVRPGSITEF